MTVKHDQVLSLDEIREGVGVFLGRFYFRAVFLMWYGFKGFCVTLRFSETLKVLLGLGFSRLAPRFILSAEAGNDRLSKGSRICTLKTK